MGEAQQLYRFLLDGNINAFASMHLNAAELDGVITTHGIGGIYKRSVACPCARPETRQPALGCPECRGLGFVYPENRQSALVVLMSGRAPNRQHRQKGEDVSDGVQLTVPTPLIPARGDQFWPDCEVHQVDELTVASIIEVDQIEAGARVLGPDQDVIDQELPPGIPLRYREPVAIEYVCWKRDDRSIAYAEPHHYRVRDGYLVFTGSFAPAPGQTVSVRYVARSVYMLHPGVPRSRRESSDGSPLPYVTRATRLDQWGDPDLR